eukprot:13355223-Heterocapsa_arctica.AAC.1
MSGVRAHGMAWYHSREQQNLQQDDNELKRNMRTKKRCRMETQREKVSSKKYRAADWPRARTPLGRRRRLQTAWLPRSPTARSPGPAS